MDTLHLFAGGGGGMLADLLLGHRPRVAVEIEPYCRAVLRKRFPGLITHDDIKTFDARPYRGRIDCVAGGFPCQDISVANHKGEGIEGPRSSLWSEMLRVVSEVRPRYVFVENSPMLRTRGLETVLRDLFLLGYDAAWTVLSAAEAGAPHLRKRMWILAELPDAQCLQLRKQSGRRCWPDWTGPRIPGDHGEDGQTAAHPHANSGRCEEQRRPVLGHEQLPSGPVVDGLRTEGPASVSFAGCERSSLWPWVEAPGPHTAAAGGGWWDAEPAVGRVVDGFPGRVASIRALGNAQATFQAVEAFRYLKAQLDEDEDNEEWDDDGVRTDRACDRMDLRSGQ